ncbi:MAG: PAS domain S-box protein, partial [Deltaproteobacteria bacterium]|nr:PAS domain S-box protein [Deltaproteobacteria bacterium]
MAAKPTYEELEQRVKELEKESVESKRIEKSLRDSEERYRLLVEGSHDVPYSVTFDGIITFIGPQVDRFGYTQEDMISKHFLEFVVREQQQEVMHIFEKGTRNKTSYPTEFQLQGKDGRLHWVEVIGEIICDNLGHPFLQIGTIREITERKQAEETLQTREKLIEALLNNQIDAATIVDKELKMLYVNKFLADRFGRSVDEMIGLSPEDVGDKADIVTAKRVAYFKQVATTGKPVRFEDKRGGIWFDTVVTPVLDKEGQVTQVAILARDITDKKLVEKALLESEERYRLLAENATDVIWTTDTNLKFTYFSASVERLCGYTPEEAVTRSAEESLSSESFEVAMNIFTEEMALVQQGNYPVGTTRTHDLELTCKDGSTVWAEVSMRFLFEDERNLVGVLGISRDITDRMKAEESLKNAHDELERRVENRTAELIKANKLLKEENEARKLTEEMLRESEETVRSLLSSPADIAIVTDTEGIVLFANEAAALRYNRKVDEFIGLSIWDLTRETSPSLAERRKAFAREVIQTAKPVRFEDERGGTWFDNIYMPIFDAKGKITRLAGLVRDVTERKQTEEALQESEEKYRSMMEAMVEPSYICTSDFHVSYMNPAMIKRTGHDATGGHCYKALNDLNERCPWCVHDAVQKGESLETEIVSPKDGRSFQISNSPIFHRDGSISKMTIYRDITERKQAEETLRESEEHLRSFMESA